jgi:hypothetical protein
MILICFAPETGVGIAARQYVKAREARDEANAEAENEGLDERFNLRKHGWDRRTSSAAAEAAESAS